ncbi:hypothetical protein DSM104299_00487 [Baekduia alba]|uniref:hypothetical protein n=1 Tax=Baekduia alba TaxID=2997333 RepID=UPI0023425F90|nr:hypothetical protein [Baekduia alba]WCB91810.1 hypothetical protein DSM104299_00487 [Baekduia alba]
MNTSITRRVMTPLAVLGAVVGIAAVLALALAGASRAAVSDAPCVGKQLIKMPLSINGKLVAKTYLFDEGSQLCAVTTSVGTDYYGQRKYMDVILYHINGQSDDRDAGYFTRYAGRVRIKDTHTTQCIQVSGNVQLRSGPNVASGPSVGDTSDGCAKG